MSEKKIVMPARFLNKTTALMESVEIHFKLKGEEMPKHIADVYNELLEILAEKLTAIERRNEYQNTKIK